jgi:hypothetical protein
MDSGLRSGSANLSFSFEVAVMVTGDSAGCVRKRERITALVLCQCSMSAFDDIATAEFGHLPPLNKDNNEVAEQKLDLDKLRELFRPLEGAIHESRSEVTNVLDPIALDYLAEALAELCHEPVRNYALALRGEEACGLLDITQGVGFGLTCVEAELMRFIMIVVGYR